MTKRPDSRNAVAIPPAFSLLGGPLHRLGTRLGLVRHGTNTVPLGLAIGTLCWMVLVALTLLDGGDPLTRAAIGPIAALLVAIPLLFVCETMLDPLASDFLRTIVGSGMVPPEAQPALHRVLARTARWTSSWLPETLCLAGAIALGWEMKPLQLSGSAAAGAHFAQGTLLRFLLLRWGWRLCQWLSCLWALSRLPLRLRPIHPDGAGGLGNLALVHAQFAPLVCAISVVLAASFANDVAAGTTTLASIPLDAAVLLAIDALLFVGPLLLFTPRLWACRIRGLSDYMELAERHSREFEVKWLGASGSPAELVGSPDISSLADLASVVDRVRAMRITPASLRLLLVLAAAALLPMLPLLWFRYPVGELAKHIIKRMAGL